MHNLCLILYYICIILLCPYILNQFCFSRKLCQSKQKFWCPTNNTIFSNILAKKERIYLKIIKNFMSYTFQLVFFSRLKDIPFFCNNSFISVSLLKTHCKFLIPYFFTDSQLSLLLVTRKATILRFLISLHCY